MIISQIPVGWSLFLTKEIKYESESFYRVSSSFQSRGVSIIKVDGNIVEQFIQFGNDIYIKGWEVSTGDYGQVNYDQRSSEGKNELYEWRNYFHEDAIVLEPLAMRVTLDGVSDGTCEQRSSQILPYNSLGRSVSDQAFDYKWFLSQLFQLAENYSPVKGSEFIKTVQEYMPGKLPEDTKIKGSFVGGLKVHALKASGGGKELRIEDIVSLLS